MVKGAGRRHVRKARGDAAREPHVEGVAAPPAAGNVLALEEVLAATREQDPAIAYLGGGVARPERLSDEPGRPREARGRSRRGGRERGRAGQDRDEPPEPHA